MTIANVHRSLIAHDIRLSLAGEVLDIDAPPGVLTPGVLARLKQYKPALVLYLRGLDSATESPDSVAEQFDDVELRVDAAAFDALFPNPGSVPKLDSLSTSEQDGPLLNPDTLALVEGALQAAREGLLPPILGEEPLFVRSGTRVIDVAKWLLSAESRIGYLRGRLRMLRCDFQDSRVRASIARVSEELAITTAEVVNVVRELQQRPQYLLGPGADDSLLLTTNAEMGLVPFSKG